MESAMDALHGGRDLIYKLPYNMALDFKVMIPLIPLIP
jgi:hypothetical protein